MNHRGRIQIKSGARAPAPQPVVPGWVFAASSRGMPTRLASGSGTGLLGLLLLSRSQSRFLLQIAIVFSTVPVYINLHFFSVLSLPGQVLINWFLSSFPEDHYLRQVLMPQDLRILAAQFCTNLLKAGVVRQLQDKDPLDSLFRVSKLNQPSTQKEKMMLTIPFSFFLFLQPDLIYYWTHAETVATAPPTPGRLSQAAWPPAMGLGLGPAGMSAIPVAQISRPGAKYTEAGTHVVRQSILSISLVGQQAR